jgi:hypothetical protein
VRVFGDRRCYRNAAGNLRFSAPSPIDEIDVGWTSAYGGVDTAALAKYGVDRVTLTLRAQFNYLYRDAEERVVHLRDAARA